MSNKKVYILGIIYLLAILFCIASDNQSAKNLIIYITTALMVSSLIYIDKKF